jgi:hypothetical protein
MIVQLRAGIVRELPVGRRGGRRRGGAGGHRPSGGRGTCCAVRRPGVGARVLSAFAGGPGGSLCLIGLRFCYSIIVHRRTRAGSGRRRM